LIRLDLYVGKTLAATTLLAWLVVAVLETLFSFLGELGDIGRGNYELADALSYVLLTLPGRAYQSFPLAALIGCMLGLGSLAAQAELDAFRLAGCSPARLTRSVLQAGVLILIAVVALGEGVAPMTWQLAGQLRTEAIFDELAVQRDAGFWVREGRKFIQVRRSEADGSLSDLSVFEIGDGPALVSTSTVSRARYHKDQWQLEGIREAVFDEQGINVTTLKQAQWPTLMDPRLAQLLSRDALTLSLPELGQYIAYLQRNGTDASSYRLSYWQRWTAPLATLAMLLLSVSLVLGPFGKYSVGQRVMIGVMVGLVFKLLYGITAHAGLVYGAAPWASALFPVVLVFAAGLWMMRRHA